MRLTVAGYGWLSADLDVGYDWIQHQKTPKNTKCLDTKCVKMDKKHSFVT